MAQNSVNRKDQCCSGGRIVYNGPDDAVTSVWAVWYADKTESIPCRGHDARSLCQPHQLCRDSAEGGGSRAILPPPPPPRADVPPSPCGKECDHGSPCILPAGHVPADQHATEHWCVFFDPRRSVSGADAVCTPPVWAEGMTCPYCDGRGYLGCRGDDDCGFCGGTGHVLRDHK